MESLAPFLRSTERVEWWHPAVQAKAQEVSFGAVDWPEIPSDPLPVVVNALRAHSTWDAMLANLPDWDRPALWP